jgi:hypothetical protein
VLAKVFCEGGSSVSIGDLWSEVNSTNGVGGKGVSVTVARDRLDASASCPLSDAGGLEDMRIGSAFH